MPPFHHCHNLTERAKRAIIPIQKSGFQTAECGHIENVEGVKERVNKKLSTIDENVETWKNYSGSLNSLKREIQRNWSRFNKSIDKLKNSLKQLKEQLGKSDTYSHIEEQRSSDFDPGASRYDDPQTDWGSESWDSYSDSSAFS
jgi:chromosome segregation ATPase